MNNNRIELTKELIESQDNYIEKLVESLNITFSLDKSDANSDVFSEVQEKALDAVEAAVSMKETFLKLGYTNGKVDDFIKFLDEHAKLLAEEKVSDDVQASFKNNRNFLFAMADFEKNSSDLGIKETGDMIIEIVLDHNKHTGKELVFEY